MVGLRRRRGGRRGRGRRRGCAAGRRGRRARVLGLRGLGRGRVNDGLGRRPGLRRPDRVVRGSRAWCGGALAVGLLVPGGRRRGRVHRGCGLRRRHGGRDRGADRGRGVVQGARREHGPAAEHRQQRNRHPGGGHERGGPAAGRQRVQRHRESGPGERLGPVRDLRPFLGGVGRGVREQAERLVLQALRQDELGQHADQGQRVDLALPVLSADLADGDVPADPLAQQGGQLSVPVIQDPGQFLARARAGPGHHERAQRGLEVGPGPGGEGLRLVARHPQRVSQVRAVELVPQAQLDDFPVRRIQPG